MNHTRASGGLDTCGGFRAVGKIPRREGNTIDRTTQRQRNAPIVGGTSIALLQAEECMLRKPVVALAVVFAVLAPIAPQAQSPSLRAVMREKSQNAQELLNPLVRADFAGIERYATRLGRLSYTEVASWQAKPSSEYFRQANAFLKAVEDLGQAADARDVDRALTAYADLVASCVNCHHLVRSSQSVSLTP
ncbi:MAG TPA: hypothetical protein VJP86_07760 [Vicinamibacterales bacterium]|nr:hypothetical protein [Vicinamibacterales bacterium]